MTRICLITIGDELLKGKILNSNAAKTGKILREAGYSLNKVVTISDTREAIKAAVLHEMDGHDMVLICGGLGPTKDDITKHTLAELFETELVMHEPTREYLVKRYARANRKLEGNSLLQAMVPANCEVVPNPNGTAPGMLFNKDGKLALSMPGVPHEMLNMVKEQALPILKEHFPVGFFTGRVLRLFGIPEAKVADRMESIEGELPHTIGVSYLPEMDGIWMELSVSGPEEERSMREEQLEQSFDKVSALLSDVCYAHGPVRLEEVVKQTFLEKGLHLAAAESLSGGALARRIVSVSGASNYFMGSVTAYDTDIKEKLLGVSRDTIEQHTVYSHEVAKKMAEGVRKLMGADVGISTTGLTERDGSTEPQVWLGYSDGKNILSVHMNLYFDRQLNMERAASHALFHCLKNVRAHFE